MILNAVLFGHGSHESAWRGADARAMAPLELSHWLACARAAESTGFDGLFLGDILCLQDRPELHPSEALDPMLVLAALTGATERLRLIGTASTSFDHPYHLARRLLTLQHLSGGRAGWNIVTSSYPQEAANIGWPGMPGTAERYARAEDVVQAVKALWSGWDGVSRLADKQSGRWLDRAPLPADHRGAYGATAGPLNLSPAPHDHPLLAQAGSSAEGMGFAARHADQIFTVQAEIGAAIAFRRRIRELAAQAGRDPDAVKVLPGVVPFVAPSRAAAEDQLAALSARTGFEHLRIKLGRFVGADLAGCDPDRPLPADLTGGQGNDFSNSRAGLLVDLAAREGWTLRQLAGRFAAGRGHLLLVGTGDEVAQVLRDWLAAGAADGFNIMAPELPSGIAAFGTQVIPLLRRA